MVLYLVGGALLAGVTLWLGGWLFPTPGLRWLIAPATVLALLALALGTRRSPERLRAIMLSALAGALLYLFSLAAGAMLTAQSHEATAAQLLEGSIWVPFAMLLMTGLPLVAFIVCVVVGALQRLMRRPPRTGERYP
ncbi:hypothetical protein FB468_0376 [Leucobacter komagatae]|uniref:Uncharacterized protein n=1 Tax=Leucobacter komagatae TaxID=55969 RepID=A0A542Y2T0_9MICO|nr:hypothetical protein FB468_0376 [Leucobacter komagatae]